MIKTTMTKTNSIPIIYERVTPLERNFIMLRQAESITGNTSIAMASFTPSYLPGVGYASSAAAGGAKCEM